MWTLEILARIIFFSFQFCFFETNIYFSFPVKVSEKEFSVKIKFCFPQKMFEICSRRKTKQGKKSIQNVGDFLIIVNSFYKEK